LAKKTELVRDIEENQREMRARLGVGVTFDVLEREVEIGGRRALLYFVDGFVKDKVTQDLIRGLQQVERAEMAPRPVESLLARHIGYFEIDTVETVEEAVEQVLSGPAVLLIDGERRAIVLDVREYPVRSIGEPDLEKVTRGSHEGFVETIVFNTAMIRRRLRDPNLRFEVQRVGERSKTDVAVGYIQDLADPGLVEEVKRRISQAKVAALPMGAKNLEEIIVKEPWNPIPRVRYTERPDVAAAHLLEGHVVILVDTTPMAMIVPVTAFHFFEHAEEFFQSPVIGTYLRWIRAIAFFVATFLTPAWLALFLSKEILPPAFEVVGPKEGGYAVPVPLQLFLLEFGSDLIRMALIHTPNALATSLGIVGAILLGELAVEVGLFVPEAIFYTAVASVGYFAVPSIEFGYTLRIYRYLLLLLVSVLRLPGLLVGVLFGLVVLARTKSVDKPFLWPLFPFHGPSLVKALFRLPAPDVTHLPRVMVQEKQKGGRPPGEKEKGPSGAAH